MNNSSRPRARLICIALLAVGAIAACAGGPRRLPPSTDIDEDAFRNAVRTLSSDEFEGRRPGTAGEEKTLAFLTAQFRRLGLKPGNGESYLQQVPMVELLPSVDPSLTVSGSGGTRSLAYRKDFVIRTERVVPAAELHRSDLVYVGYGIVAPEYSWDDYAGTDVRGKTVVMLVNDPGHADSNPPLFKGRTMSSYGRSAYKFEEAARHGASGVLLIHDAEAAGSTWDEIQTTGSGAQLVKAAADGNAGAVAVEGWLSAAAAQAMFKQAGLDLGQQRAAAARSGFKAVPLGLQVDAEIHDSIRRITSANVVAILPGQKRRHDYIVYTAHWDHMGRAATPAGEVVYPGAVDNASGVAGLLVIAESFTHSMPPPDRSIVFVALTGGESGLIGSSYYVDNPPFPLADTVADINLDALHLGGPTRDVTVIGFGQSELEGFLRDAAALQGRELHADPNPEAGDFFRSDNYSFARVGVPSLYAVAGLDDSARGPAWGRTQLDEYQSLRRYRPGDRYSDDWDVRSMVQDLTLFYRLGLRLSQTRRFPNWLAGSEYRAIREQSRENAAD